MKVTQQRATELKKKIEFYRSRKENNIFDSFYHADLDVFVALIDANTMTPEEEEEQASKRESGTLGRESEETEREEDAMLAALSAPLSGNPTH